MIEPPPEPEIIVDPTLEVAERQLALLGELGQMTMRVARAFECLAIDAAHAAHAKVVNKFSDAEAEGAKAAAAKDAALSFDKVSRAVRLTFMLEKATAEWLRDIRNGIVARRDAPTQRKRPDWGAIMETALERARPINASSPERDADRHDSETERLVDIERPDVLPRVPPRQIVDRVSRDIGASADWDTSTLRAPDLADPGVAVDWSARKVGAPTSTSRGVGVAPSDTEPALPP
jgi:hypothetical protein